MENRSWWMILDWILGRGDSCVEWDAFDTSEEYSGEFGVGKEEGQLLRYNFFVKGDRMPWPTPSRIRRLERTPRRLEVPSLLPFLGLDC